jgi:hypothetical protein
VGFFAIKTETFCCLFEECIFIQILKRRKVNIVSIKLKGCKEGKGGRGGRRSRRSRRSLWRAGWLWRSSIRWHVLAAKAKYNLENVRGEICWIFYPDGSLSGGGDCSLEEGGEGHDGGEESGELHVEMNSSSWMCLDNAGSWFIKAARLLCLFSLLIRRCCPVELLFFAVTLTGSKSMFYKQPILMVK